MGMITTEAWVLYQSSPESSARGPAELRREEFSFPDITEYEVLAAPIYGCWEGNMSHAIERQPVDICRQRGEPKVVIGNAGIVRILKIGARVTNVREGDLCLFAAIGSVDDYGYLLTVVGYDARGSIGVLAKRIKVHEKQVCPIPRKTRFSVPQWGAFSLRYVTAWANWKLAYGCWRLQMGEELCPAPYVWGWGGGVTLAELTLAKFYGCRAAMMASRSERLALIEELGINPIDRRPFSELDFDAEQYQSDSAYKRRYREAEKTFLHLVRRETQGAGVSIFIDNIGTPVFRATLKALGRQGIITTVGWKKGMDLSIVRATECINRHIHVFSHGARYSDFIEASRFAEEIGWMAPPPHKIYRWEEIPTLARDFAQGETAEYFPLFEINPL
jgi:NADPH:quinone reductase-like Zn-dependent oxidoreductase